MPSAAPSATVTTAGRLRTVTDLLATLLGEPSADLVGRQLDAFASTSDDAASLLACLSAVAHDDGGQVRVRLTSSDGRELGAHLVVTNRPGDELTVVVIDETGRVDAEHELARSQRRWLALLRNSTDIVFTTDDAGELTSVTSAVPERLGWTTGDVLGRTGLSFVHPDDRPAARQAWLDVSCRGVPQVQLEARLLHADRSATWTRLVLSDLRHDPDVRAVIGNVTDIAGQKQEQARRRLEESRFRARFDQSRLPQVIQAEDGTYEDANDAFCALVGRRREDLVGLPCMALMHPDDSGETELVTRSLRRGEAESAQVDGLLAHADGHPVPARIDATLLRDADGNPDGCAVSLQDLRPLRDSEQARDDLQDLFDVVAARSQDFVVLHAADGRTLYSSPAGQAMFGDRHDSTTHRMIDLVHPDDADEALQHWDAVTTRRESRTYRFRARSVDGRWIWVEQTSTNLLDTRIGAIVSTVRDVTSAVEAAEALRLSEARYRAIAETAEEGILVIAPGGAVAYANARIAAILGIDLEQIIDRHVWSVLEGATADEVAEKTRTRRSRGPERYEVPYHHPDGTWRALRVSASPMPDVDGLDQGSLAMISDITEQRRGEQELLHAAQHDELTGLLNRSVVMDQLDRRCKDGNALLFIDLDHFKTVNDGSGHTAGDAVLVEVASRLRGSLRADDLIARFGGDEFVVVLDESDEDTALSTARRLLDVLSTPYRLRHHTLRVGATIGVAMGPASSADELLRFADTAMYAAKTSGRGRVRLFDRRLAEQAEERFALGAELLTALATDMLEMHYQPVIDIVTGEVAGVEALARWHHPTRGTIAPSRFVALAELTASSADLDRWVVSRAMRDVAELKADWTMPEPATVSINLSGQSLAEGFDDYIICCAEEAGLTPDLVILEITESAIMVDKDIAIDVLQRLRDHGFGIAIDDFGTGYSSMAYLRDLPITVMKIDRGFVRGIPEDAHSLAIVTSLMELARSLDLTVVAEGVETPEHLAALRAIGCTLAQGWLWSAAVSPAELRKTEMFSMRFDVLDP